jgi:hypothetical protein
MRVRTPDGLHGGYTPYKLYLSLPTEFVIMGLNREIVFKLGEVYLNVELIH